MNAYEKLIRAFTIFSEYPAGEDGPSYNVAHDEMWAGPDPDLVSAEHLAELEQLGWDPDGDGCFHHWTSSQ